MCQFAHSSSTINISRKLDKVFKYIYLRHSSRTWAHSCFDNFDFPLNMFQLPQHIIYFSGSCLALSLSLFPPLRRLLFAVELPLLIILYLMYASQLLPASAFGLYLVSRTDIGSKTFFLMIYSNCYDVLMSIYR